MFQFDGPLQTPHDDVLSLDADVLPFRVQAIDDLWGNHVNIDSPMEMSQQSCRRGRGQRPLEKELLDTVGDIAEHDFIRSLIRVWIH